MTPPIRPRILIVEDDEAVRQTLADLLQVNGFDPVTAGTGEEGLARARQDEPALVLTDLSMPGLTGFQLIEAMRRDAALCTVPVIVISAKADRAATRRGMELGAEDFISKPFTEAEVIRSIQTRLEKKGLLDELDAFAHTVAHDLKAPLSVVKLRADLLELTWHQDDDETKHKHVREIVAATNQLGRIVDELLLLTGVLRQPITPGPVDMTPVVGEALARLEPLIAQARAKISQPAAWPAASGYAPWLVEVWTNYISNAVKYGGNQPQITLGGDLVPDGSRVRFWVQDAGPGIDPAVQAALFVPFARISTIRASGHGLGLPIVRRILEKLGGQVGVESHPGRGARFWFELSPVPRAATISPFPS
ncbi:MAG: response regulator [Opitutaceae bacterium]|nr:response regulator [Opitutaceae bacterium]